MWAETTGRSLGDVSRTPVRACETGTGVRPGPLPGPQEVSTESLRVVTIHVQAGFTGGDSFSEAPS